MLCRTTDSAAWQGGGRCVSAYMFSAHVHNDIMSLLLRERATQSNVTRSPNERTHARCKMSGEGAPWYAPLLGMRCGGMRAHCQHGVQQEHALRRPLRPQGKATLRR